MDGMWLRPITDHVCMLVSIFLAPMLKSCPLNGNSKLDPVKVFLWEMTCGLQGFFCIVLLRNLELWLQWIPSLCLVTGMELVHTPTFQLWPLGNPMALLPSSLLLTNFLSITSATSKPTILTKAKTM